MKPKSITVSVKVPQPREQVYEYLDVLANHEGFTDHVLVNWSYSGPRAGLGARARLRAKVPGPEQWVDMTVISAQPPITTTEESVGTGGKRRTQGTYVLGELPDGGTDITFELKYFDAPAIERMLGPVIRAGMKRANAKAMQRLADTLAQLPTGRPSVEASADPIRLIGPSRATDPPTPARDRDHHLRQTVAAGLRARTAELLNR